MTTVEFSQDFIFFLFESSYILYAGADQARTDVTSRWRKGTASAAGEAKIDDGLIFSDLFKRKFSQPYISLFNTTCLSLHV